MTLQFTSPATTSTNTLKAADLVGHLLVVIPQEFVEGMQTANGITDAIRVTIHDITDQTTVENALWFNKILVGSLKNLIGQQVLAVMARGQAKPGQSAPYILNDASSSPEAVEAATKYLLGQTPTPQLVEDSTGDPTDMLAAALQGLGAKVINQ